MIDGDPAWVSKNPERAQESKPMLTDVYLTQALTILNIRSIKRRSRCAVRSEGVCVCVCVCVCVWACPAVWAKERETEIGNEEMLADKCVSQRALLHISLPRLLFLQSTSQHRINHCLDVHTFLGLSLAVLTWIIQTSGSGLNLCMKGHQTTLSVCLSLLWSQGIIFAHYN